MEMTCKDCKYWETCTDTHKKDYIDEEYGDSYAWYCENFESAQECYSVEKNGIINTQSSTTWNTMLIDKSTNRMLLHAYCKTHKTKEQLLEEIDEYPKLMEALSKPKPWIYCSLEEVIDSAD